MTATLTAPAVTAPSGQPAAMSAPVRRLPEGARVRLLAAGGLPQAGLTVVRAATRNDSDRQLLVEGPSCWWVTRHTDGVTRVCAYLGDQQAERDYEMFLLSPSPAGPWKENEVVPQF